MSNSQSKSSKKNDDDKTISFEYKISPNYLVYNINGAHGGLTPSGDILMNVFYERPPIPKTTVHEINSEGKLGKEIKQETKRPFKHNLKWFWSEAAK